MRQLYKHLNYHVTENPDSDVAVGEIAERGNALYRGNEEIEIE